MPRDGLAVRALILGAIGVVAVATAAIVLNLVLLGYASPRTEPVGRLNPVAGQSRIAQSVGRAPRPRSHESGPDD